MHALGVVRWAIKFQIVHMLTTRVSMADHMGKVVMLIKGLKVANKGVAHDIISSMLFKEGKTWMRCPTLLPVC